MGIAYNKKAPQKRGLVMLVGRARFELATNGLKVKNEVFLLYKTIA